MVDPWDDLAGRRVCPAGPDARIRDGLARTRHVHPPPRAECWAGEAVRIVQGYPQPEPDRGARETAGLSILFTPFRFLCLCSRELWNLSPRGGMGPARPSLLLFMLNSRAGSEFPVSFVPSQQRDMAFLFLDFYKVYAGSWPARFFQLPVYFLIASPFFLTFLCWKYSCATLPQQQKQIPLFLVKLFFLQS